MPDCGARLRLPVNLGAKAPRLSCQLLAICECTLSQHPLSQHRTLFYAPQVQADLRFALVSAAHSVHLTTNWLLLCMYAPSWLVPLQICLCASCSALHVFDRSGALLLMPGL